MTLSTERSQMPDLEFGAATDVGRVRSLNEDAVLAGPRLFAVADGMGGHAAGEVAAALALRSFAPIAERSDAKADDIIAGIEDANAAILDTAAHNARTLGMGTTLTGVYLGEFGGSPHWFAFNVGDSRVYRYADGILTQLTVDHSEVEELLSAGRITRQQAKLHPRRNVITRSLGTIPAPVPDIWVLPSVSGETFVVCSDGLTTEVDEDDILVVLRRDLPAQQVAETLCQMAVEAGGHDNVSVVVVRDVDHRGNTEVDIATVPRSIVVQPS